MVVCSGLIVLLFFRSGGPACVWGFGVMTDLALSSLFPDCVGCGCESGDSGSLARGSFDLKRIC